MDVAINLEKAGICARIFPGGEPPRVFKGATINTSQLTQIRSVAAVRLGCRAVSESAPTPSKRRAYAQAH